MSTPALGYILPQDRTQEQQDAHAAAVSRMRAFAMPGYADPPKGTKVLLTDFWKHPDVVADLGQEFFGFGQYTGSCVGVSEGNCLTTVLSVQRCIEENPTKAEIVWWPFPYGRTRYLEGDRGQGEGAVVSVMGTTLQKEGYFTIHEAGLPAFTKNDSNGMWLSKTIEMQWSDGGRIDPKWITKAAERKGMSKSVCNNAVDVRASIINGYPVHTGSGLYVSGGFIKGDGTDAYVRGKYDTRGGHATSYLGVWNHPNDGWLYLYSNQWPTNTYPKDPAGGGRCTVWLPESEVNRLFNSLGGDGGETYSIYNVPGQPAQPKVVSWFI